MCTVEDVMHQIADGRVHLEGLVQDLSKLGPDCSGLGYTLKPSHNTYTGIDGNPDRGLAFTTMPIGILGVHDFIYKADLIG